MGPGFESLKVHHLSVVGESTEQKKQKKIKRQRLIVSVINDEGPPVPIPNTVVKLICADNTWLETAR